jgi:plasmid stabilization system protein ParE
MPRLTWTPQALSDVQRLHRFLASKNIDAAQRAVQAIRQGVKVLALQPSMGRPIEDLPIEFREWLIDFGNSGYMARYRLDADLIVVLAVRHQRETGF